MLYQICHATPDSRPGTIANGFHARNISTFLGRNIPKTRIRRFCCCEMIVGGGSAKNQKLIAFAAWASSYDLHHCMKEGEAINLFVDSAYRGRGVATKLIFVIAIQNSAAGRCGY